MYKMIKDEIEEDKIDIETSVPLPTYNCTEELDERLDIFILFILDESSLHIIASDLDVIDHNCGG